MHQPSRAPPRACYVVVFGDGVASVDGQGSAKVDGGSCVVVGDAGLVVLVVEAGAVVDV